MTLLFTTANTRILLLVANLFFGTVAISEAGVSDPGAGHQGDRAEENMVQIAPFDIDIRFEQRGAAVVDLASLKVFLMKLWNIDITDRVKPYASGDGIHLTHADFPKGQHTVRQDPVAADGTVVPEEPVGRLVERCQEEPPAVR